MSIIRKFIAEKIGFPLQDAVKGTNINKTLRFLQHSQYWTKEQMDEYKLKKLKKLIDYSYRHVPYYKELFDSINLSPTDIRNLSDIKKIPILTKEIARLNREKLCSNELHKFKIKKGKTGGTTGVPFSFLSDTQNRSFVWAAYYRWYEWIGIKRADRVLTFWGTKKVLSKNRRVTLKDNLMSFIQNNKTINSFNLNAQTLPKVYDEIIKYNPVLIKGYLSALILVAKYMEENNLPPNKGLKALSSTTETLLPIHRELLERVFNKPIYNQYGSGEIPGIAFECKEQNGLHLTEEHVLLECLNDEGDDVIGENGRLILTNLDNFVMPFIRYEVGDDAIISDNVTCKCGVNALIIQEISGRTTDTVLLKDGSRVHGVFFTDIFHEIGITTQLISRFQLIQYNDKKVKLILETKNEIPEKTITILRNKMLLFLDDVEIVLQEFIDTEENGKFKYIKTEN